MANKLFLTSLVMFFPVRIQMPAALFWITGFVILVLLNYPWIRKGDDRLHLYCQNNIYLVILAGYVLSSIDVSDGYGDDDLAMSVVLIILTIALFLLFILMTVQNSRKLIRLFQARRNQKADVKETEMENVEIKKALAIVPTNPLFEGTGETTKHLFVNTIDTENMTGTSSTLNSPVSKAAGSTKKAAGVELQCDECETDTATVRCDECQQNLCAACCESLHRQGKRSQHVFASLAAAPPKPVSRQSSMRQKLGVDDDEDNTTLTGGDDENTTASGDFNEDNYVAEVEKNTQKHGGARAKAAVKKLKKAVEEDEQNSAQKGLAGDIDDINNLMTDD